MNANKLTKTAQVDGPRAAGPENSSNSKYSVQSKPKNFNSQFNNAIYDNGRPVAYVRRGGVLFRHLHGEKSFLKHPPGIAFAVKALKEAARMGAIEVECLDTETGISYKASMRAFYEKGTSIHRAGWSEQICLTINNWRTDDPKAPRQMALAEVTNPGGEK